MTFHHERVERVMDQTPDHDENDTGNVEGIEDESEPVENGDAPFDPVTAVRKARRGH